MFMQLITESKLLVHENFALQACVVLFESCFIIIKNLKSII